MIGLYFFHFKLNGSYTLGPHYLLTDLSVRIMLLYPILSLILSSGLFIYLSNIYLSVSILSISVYIYLYLCLSISFYLLGADPSETVMAVNGDSVQAETSMDEYEKEEENHTVAENSAADSVRTGDLIQVQDPRIRL